MADRRGGWLARVVLFPLLVSGVSQARGLEEQVARYYLREASRGVSVLERMGDRCEPVTPSGKECIEYVAGAYAGREDRLSAARACIGNRGLDCARYVAGDYASREDRVSAARSCSRVEGLDCAKYVAGDYASRSERSEAAQACKNSSLDCVKSVVGSYPSRSDRIRAARACAGEDE
jgi:hypothetical protein